MLSYAVIGTSRGIGLEYVRQLASRAETVVFAVVRNPVGSTHLKALSTGLTNVHIIPGDIVDYNSLENAAKQISRITGGKLDYLIHNAASTDVNSVNKGFDDYANMDELDAAFISTAVCLPTSSPPVSSNQAALVVTLCPGMVDCSATAADADGEKLSEILKEVCASIKLHTGLEMAPQTPEASVGEQLKVIEGLQGSHNGMFLMHTGEEVRRRD